MPIASLILPADIYRLILSFVPHHCVYCGYRFKAPERVVPGLGNWDTHYQTRHGCPHRGPYTQPENWWEQVENRAIVSRWLSIHLSLDDSGTSRAQDRFDSRIYARDPRTGRREVFPARTRLRFRDIRPYPKRIRGDTGVARVD